MVSKEIEIFGEKWIPSVGNFWRPSLVNIYKAFIQPYLSYCITVWGPSVKSNNDSLVKLQNKVLRIMFACKRTADVFTFIKEDEIMTVEHLFITELLKLCLKHHRNDLPPDIYNIMPTIKSECDFSISTRSSNMHNYSYDNNSLNKTLSLNCIKLWNKLPSDIKETAYTSKESTKKFTKAVLSHLSQTLNSN